MLRAYRPGLGLVCQMGIDDIDRLPADIDTRADRGSKIVQRLKLSRRRLDHRQARQDRVAIAFGRSRRIDCGEIDAVVVEQGSDAIRLIGQVLGLVLQNFLQADHVGIRLAQHIGNQPQPGRPIARIVPDIERHDLQRRCRASPIARGTGGERQRGGGRQKLAAVEHGDTSFHWLR